MTDDNLCWQTQQKSREITEAIVYSILCSTCHTSPVCHISDAKFQEAFKKKTKNAWAVSARRKTSRHWLCYPGQQRIALTCNQWLQSGVSPELQLVCPLGIIDIAQIFTRWPCHYFLLLLCFSLKSFTKQVNQLSKAPNWFVKMPFGLFQSIFLGQSMNQPAGCGSAFTFL